MADHDLLIIGAGISGLTTLKMLEDYGIEAVCFEASDRIGGNWAFGAYAGLHDDRETLRWVTDEVMNAIMELTGQTYVEAYGTSLKSGSLTAADAEARVLPRPGYGATPPELPSGGLS